MKEADIKLVREWVRSPAKFIESIWGLVPQPLKEGYVVGINTKLEDITVEWFEGFEEGKHITWQQWVIFLAVERGIMGGSTFISVASGRGIGKSTTMAWLLLWFLVCHKDCNIPCTAPTAQQMYDVLWKEVAKWHAKMPSSLRDLIEIQSSYVRIKERPSTWWARAATARKENPEALSGVHSEDVFLFVDEASAVPDEVIKTGEESLTNKKAFILLISNYTRLSGYFHDSQQNKYKDWCVLRFNGEDSPIVEQPFLDRQIRDGRDSDSYRVSVLGLPPNAGVEISGYVPLLQRSDLRFTLIDEFVQPIILGVDPSGEGRNKTAFVVRDQFKAKCIGKFLDMKVGQIADFAVMITEELKIMPENTIIDSFGVGADVINEFMKMRKYIQGVLVGNPADDKERYMNKKAQMYWRMREWIIKGGALVGTFEGWEEVLSIMYSAEAGRIRMMGKKMMRDNNLKSPDMTDALMLTFLREEYETPLAEWEKKKEEYFNPYAGL